MKKLLLSALLLSFFITSAFGQCEGNRMALKKQGERDWVKDYYDRLEKTYPKKEPVISLRIYFYQNNIVKTCISYDSLKLLQKDLEIVFPKPDKLVSELKATIAGIIKKNPKGFSTEPISDFSPSIADSTNDIIADDSEVIADDSEIDKLNEKIIKLEKYKSLWFWISIVSFLGLISLLILYLFDRKKLTEQIALKDDIFNKSQRETFEFDDNAVRLWQEKYFILQKQKDNLEKEYSDFKNNFSKLNVEKQVEKEVATSQNIAKIATQEVAKQFYLSIPTPTDDGLGIFRDMRQIQANPTSSFYRFELEHDETKAKFWFLDNPNTIQSAVIYPETYINPVCDYEEFNSNAKKIVTKIPGIAVKEGDIWKVRTKAKIRFE
ncbi:hypothetical protein [Emticicia sp.]|uniref:hypothetical protein n=1 Tax=Emticicia sp. TaxID=1930953 RepID=UPI003751DB7A